MKVLVTGACGFIGSHLVDALVRKKYEVIATDLETAPRDFLDPGVVFIPGDLSEEKDMKSLFSDWRMRWVQTVFHAGAIFDFFPSWAVMHKNNVVGTKNVCVNFAGLPGLKRLILFSSGVVTNKILQKSNYGHSKLAQESVLKYFAYKYRGSFEAVIVRPAAVVGPRSRYGAAKIIELIAGGQMQFFVGKKDIYAPIVHVKDVARAVIRLSKASWPDIAKDGGLSVPVFDLVDDSHYSYEDLLGFAVGLLEETHGAKIISVYLPVWLVGLLAGWQEFLARELKTRPKISLGMLDFFKETMRLDNSLIKKIGFNFGYPDSKKAVKDAMRWYLKEGWL